MANVNSVIILKAIKATEYMGYMSWYGHRLELPFHLVEQNREVFTRKSSFVVIFFLAGDLVGIVCCLGAFNREEDVVFGYVHFINSECCILSIRTHGSQMTFV